MFPVPSILCLLHEFESVTTSRLSCESIPVCLSPFFVYVSIYVLCTCLLPVYVFLAALKKKLCSHFGISGKHHMGEGMRYYTEKSLKD